MSAPEETGHRVLIVEDDPPTADDLRAVVESRGDRPRVATTVEEAKAALAEERFCYVLCDQQLPNRTGDMPLVSGGERVMRAARKTDERKIGSFHVLPVVVVTSYSGHEDFVSKMYDLGATAFMSKPVRPNLERLLEKLTVATERAKRATHEECAAHAPVQDDGQDEESPMAVEYGGIAAQLGATTFATITIRVIDGHIVRIAHQRRGIRASYIDLGFATKARMPTREWPLLLDICAGHGRFRWKKYGDFNTAKQKVHHLRKKLVAAFGLDESPFHEFRVVDGWRARFFASSEIADGDD